MFQFLESGVREVILSYSTDEGVTWANGTMSKVNGDVYLEQIPGFPAGTGVHYKITVYDNAGNPAVKDNAGEYYVYTVIPEFPPSLILAIFVTAALFALIIEKKLLHPKSKKT